MGKISKIERYLDTLMESNMLSGQHESLLLSTTDDLIGGDNTGTGGCTNSAYGSCGGINKNKLCTNWGLSCNGGNNTGTCTTTNDNDHLCDINPGVTNTAPSSCGS